MTSSINFGAIDETFPIAGQDNDSNGFRQNFAAIQSALASAKSEIEDLQNKSVLTETLGSATETVSNNLGGSTIKNGVYSQLNGAVPSSGEITVSDGTGDIDLDQGPFQVFKIIGGDATLRFTNWTADVYNVVRVHIYSDNNVRFVALATELAGKVIYENDKTWLSYDSEAETYSIELSATGTTHVAFEAWSYDGSVVFVRPLGTYATA